MPGSIDKMKRIKALNSNKDLQYLLNEAYKILGNPLYIHDRTFHLIAHTEGITTDDPIWNEIISNGTFDFARLEFFKDECFFDEMASAKKITFIVSDKLKYDRLFGKLFNKDYIQVCCVILVACEKPFYEEEPQLFEAFCDVLDKALSKDDFFKEYGRTYLESLVSMLIDGKLRGKELFYSSRVESIYDKLKANLFLAAVDVSRCETPVLEHKYFEELFRKAQPEYKYYIYSGYVLILASTDYEKLDIKYDFNKLNRLFAKHEMFAGISSRFENLFELQTYYGEAVEALNFGLNGIRNNTIFFFDKIEQDS